MQAADEGGHDRLQPDAAALNSADDGGIKDTATDMKIPNVGQFMMDMMVMALACDMTGVISLQWTDTEAKHTFPWLNLSEHHHYYQHDGGFRPTECAQIETWYSQMHLYLLQEMQAVDMGGHSLLDESVVFFGSELADPPIAREEQHAVHAGGRRRQDHANGALDQVGGVPHNELLDVDPERVRRHAHQLRRLAHRFDARSRRRA